MLPGIDLPSSRYSLTDGLRNTLGKSGDSSSSIWSLSILWSGSRTAGTLATRGGLRARFERMFCCGRWCSSEPSVMKRREYVCVHLSDLKNDFWCAVLGDSFSWFDFSSIFRIFGVFFFFLISGWIRQKRIDGEKLIAYCAKKVWATNDEAMAAALSVTVEKIIQFDQTHPCTHLTQMSARVHQKMFYKSNEQEKLAKTATFQQQFTLFSTMITKNKIQMNWKIVKIHQKTGIICTSEKKKVELTSNTAHPRVWSHFHNFSGWWRNHHGRDEHEFVFNELWS